ncbi:MAG: hypothetical protein R3D03_01445 [Geminicoccaceae bacterium]
MTMRQPRRQSEAADEFVREAVLPAFDRSKDNPGKKQKPPGKTPANASGKGLFAQGEMEDPHANNRTNSHAMTSKLEYL